MITGLATGYYQLDELTSGFQPGEMIIIAARPSMGKTSLPAEHGRAHGRRGQEAGAAVFSLEMSKEQLAQRLLCSSHARFDLPQMRRGRSARRTGRGCRLAAGDLEQAPIFIDDSPELTMLQLRAKARRLKAATTSSASSSTTSSS